MDMSLNAIRDRLEQLRTAKQRPAVFGADSHGFILSPPLTESVVQRFEAVHHVRLPHDYREFLITLGDGGAGPYYGVFRLGEMDDGHGFQNWKEGDGFVGVLSKPFPHTT